jgi:hypothetical protein
VIGTGVTGRLRAAADGAALVVLIVVAVRLAQ